MLFEYTNHNEDMYINQFESLQEIEEEIISSAGITNPFTSYQIPIINGNIRRYNITFENELDGIVYDFIKGKHDKLKPLKNIFDKSVDPKEGYQEYIFKNVKIYWID